MTKLMQGSYSGVERMLVWWGLEWSVIKSSRPAAALRALRLILALFPTLAPGLVSAGTAAAGAARDVQLIGLPPLYEALFAVANCPNVSLDQRRFARAAALYHLAPADFKIDGSFGVEVADLSYQDRVRLDDDRAAFCSVNRLSFAIPFGVLVDRGPVVPHPLPFSLGPPS